MHFEKFPCVLAGHTKLINNASQKLKAHYAYKLPLTFYIKKFKILVFVFERTSLAELHFKLEGLCKSG
jgi:hypothetical protein